jgi:hypothetical protein
MIIGSQKWPTSWITTPMRPCFAPALQVPSGSGRGPLKQIIGYSMPPTGPFTLIATGYGYGSACRE